MAQVAESRIARSDAVALRTGAEFLRCSTTGGRYSWRANGSAKSSSIRLSEAPLEASPGCSTSPPHLRCASE